LVVREGVDRIDDFNGFDPGGVVRRLAAGLERRCDPGQAWLKGRAHVEKSTSGIYMEAWIFDSAGIALGAGPFGAIGAGAGEQDGGTVVIGPDFGVSASLEETKNYKRRCW